ncbi:hypothetical protein QTI33_32040 [Variovorax sp. J22P271]|uniref:deazapurine DNA modification protein DpdA family protein n=1 Tax=Variovorax davisae TaxID=3053515 RepID=UPI002576CBEE|nr:hypothetical protein [Variovorax sp. J22P271]MDM0036804.1 hypothetical protein [Variovorax sp. J22P271]
MTRKACTEVRVGVPLTGGRLVAAARERGYPVLFSANAFARNYPKGHEREGSFKAFRLPDPLQFEGLDAALDSAGYVAAVAHRDYRWSVEDYFDLVAAHPWKWAASMDYCCEREIAGDRPMRLLRMAATAFMLGRCRAEARGRGLQAPMPVLQGWTPDEYVTCAEWLPLTEWPELVGIGSVCRRQIDGSDGILAILEAVDAILPAHTRCHLFGVKSTVLELIADHPRVASVDSMAWDVQARVERRTGRDMDFRISHMEAWTTKQQRIASSARPGATGVQTMLFDPAAFGGLNDHEALVLEGLALQYAELVMSGDIDYLDAVSQSMRDGVTVIAILRNQGLTPEALEAFDDIIAGFADRVRPWAEI